MRSPTYSYTKHQGFEREKEEICAAGLASSPWQHLDQTTGRVAGVNQTINIIGNPFYNIYVTTAKKDRLSVLQALENGRELEFLLNRFTYELLSKFEVPPKWQKALRQLPQRVFSQFSFQALLEQHLPGLVQFQETFCAMEKKKERRGLGREIRARSLSDLGIL